jgi:hypothetical protein
VGYGAISDPVSILAAQIPDQPSAPTTTVSDDNVSVTWEQPDVRGSPITAYEIRIRESDLVTYTEYKPTCDGSSSSVYSVRVCSIPISVLRSAPFNLAWGDSVHAIIAASNLYGQSVFSADGNGAVILTVPDAPLNLANVAANTNANQIGL